MGYNLLISGIYVGYNPLLLTFDLNFQQTQHFLSACSSHQEPENFSLQVEEQDIPNEPCPGVKGDTTRRLNFILDESSCGIVKEYKKKTDQFGKKSFKKKCQKRLRWVHQTFFANDRG